MQVVVEVVSGPAAGKKILVGAGHMLQVGRTEWADYALPHDGHLSSVHFRLENDATACYLRDLGSSNGTFVNGRQVKDRVRLHDGDQIRAGQTIFTVHAEGAQRPDGAADGAGRSLGPTPAFAGAAPIPLPPKRGKVAFTAELCDSGLTLCRGSVEQIPPAELAILLGESTPAWLIVDFHHLGEPPPPELIAPGYLFDWLDPAVVQAVSPVVLGNDDLPTWPTLLESGWGKDAVVGLFSRQDKPALLDHLRRSCRTKAGAPQPNDPIIGYCWPSVLAPLLSHYAPDFVQRLLEGIDAVLVEFPDLPDTWQLYGRQELVGLLCRLGFELKPVEEGA